MPKIAMSDPNLVQARTTNASSSRTTNTAMASIDRKEPLLSGASRSPVAPGWPSSDLTGQS
jgi:hypothetical protein